MKSVEAAKSKPSNHEKLQLLSAVVPIGAPEDTVRLYGAVGSLHAAAVPRNENKLVYSAHSTACRSPSGTGPSSAIMADALTSVRAIRAADTITYIDHFGGDSEGPASTAVLARHIRYKGSTFS